MPLSPMIRWCLLNTLGSYKSLVRHAVCGLFLFCAFSWSAVLARDAGPSSEQTHSPPQPISSPLPRFASLSVAKASLRLGPSRGHPVEWIFVLKNMPVEVIQSFDHWRKIRDHEGTEGWVHAGKLSNNRYILAKREGCNVYKTPDAMANVVATMEKSSLAKVRQCKAGWCEIDAQDVQGWVSQADVWGVYPEEEFSPKRCWIPFLCK